MVATARYGLTTPAPTSSLRPPGGASAVAINRRATCAGVRLGKRARISATVPETSAAAKLVPP
jgi:hypothetical protein